MMKKYRLRKAVVFIAILCKSVATQAQAPADSIAESFGRYSGKVLHEKIFAHLDQQFYLTGETVWFSLYDVDATFHKPLHLSKIAYVEVIDQNNKPVIQAKVALKDGRGQGALYLPATINSGNFVFRAYTSWMKNSSPAFYFHQPITIVNPFISPETSKSRTTDNRRVEFFPEGGHLVKGLRSTVGVKVSDAQEKGIEFAGALINSKNDTVTRFKPLKFGIGKFVVTPADEPYRAVIRDTQNRVTIHHLPAAEPEGYTMSVTDSAQRWIKITVSASFAHSEGSFVYLFGHARQATAHAEIKRIQRGQSIFLVDREKLPYGVCHFTVFNEQRDPVCERLYFMRPEKQLAIEPTTNKPEYGARRKVTLQIKTNAAEAQYGPAELSVAVSKIDSPVHRAVRQIDHYFWLSSDLTGEIEGEAYYFNREDPFVDEATDNLLLTHGWRRFKWPGVFMPSSNFPFLPEYRGHIVQADVSRGGHAVPGILTFLSVPGTASSLYPARSTDKGELRFEINSLQGPHKFVFRPEPSESDPVLITLRNPFSAEFHEGVREPFMLPGAYEKGLLQRMIAMQAQDIYHADRQHAGERKSGDTIAFYGKADETYYLDRYTRFPVMEEVMREYVPGVFVRKRKDGFHFLVPDMVNGYMLEGEPMILLDGVPLFHADRIMAVDPLKIRKLEVVKRRFFQGPSSYPGVVSYTTYEGDMAGIELDPEAVVVDHEGLQMQREFYHPVYATQKQIASRIPDRRYLLYWNPRVRTGDDGSLQIEFYTSDVQGRYQVAVQGLCSSGYGGSSVAYFTVK